MLILVSAARSVFRSAFYLHLTELSLFIALWNRLVSPVPVISKLNIILQNVYFHKMHSRKLHKLYTKLKNCIFRKYIMPVNRYHITFVLSSVKHSSKNRTSHVTKRYQVQMYYTTSSSSVGSQLADYMCVYPLWNTFAVIIWLCVEQNGEFHWICNRSYNPFTVEISSPKNFD